MAFIMYTSITDFFGEYLKDFKQGLEGKYQVVVVSRDIISGVKRRYEDTATTTYKSKYKNIDFLDALMPGPAVQELSWGTSPDMYAMKYSEQLSDSKAMYELCCIADSVINDDRNIFILCSNAEYKQGYLDILREFIYNNFKLKAWSYTEYMNDHEVLNEPIDLEEAKKVLAFQIKANNLEDEIVGGLFNQYLHDEDVEKTYKEILMKKTPEELFRMGVQKNIYINKRKPKEVIVDQLMGKLLKS